MLLFKGAANDTVYGCNVVRTFHYIAGCGQQMLKFVDYEVHWGLLVKSNGKGEQKIIMVFLSILFLYKYYGRAIYASNIMGYIIPILTNDA